MYIFRTLPSQVSLFALTAGSLWGVAVQAITAPSVVYPSSTYTLSANQLVNIVPFVSGLPAGVPLNCQQGGPLPPGLQLNPKTCAISGQLAPNFPPNLPPLQTAVLANVPGGPIPLTFNLVNASMSYYSSTYNLYNGQKVYLTSRLVGLLPGQSAQCVALTPLPPGLQIDRDNCSITGQVLTYINPAQASFKVQIGYAFGPPTTLNFNVLPQEVRYNASSYNLWTGQTVLLAPGLIGFQPGMNNTCQVLSELPWGLSLDPETCAITGKVGFIPPNAPHNFSVTIAASALPMPIVLQMNILEPSLSYNSNYTFHANDTVFIIPYLRGVQPGQPVNCRPMSPLPPGMQLDPNTCAIVGRAISMGSTAVTMQVQISSALSQVVVSNLSITVAP